MSAPYNPNKEGWGFAAVVCLLTAGMLYGAYSIHERTYRHPRDPMMVQVYHDRDQGGDHGGGHDEASDASHGEAKGESKGEH
jgi:hypothetical protein